MLKDAGVVDAGGAGFLLLLDAALHVVDGEPLPEPRRRRRRADGADVRRRRPPRVGRRRRARRQRAALRGDVPVRPRRRPHRGVQAAVGRDRRLDRRRRRRRHLELPRPHERHRRRHRGRARPRRAAAPDPVTDLFEEVAAEHAAARGGDARRAAGAGRPSAARPSRTAVVAVSSGAGHRRAVRASSACRASSPAARR